MSVLLDTFEAAVAGRNDVLAVLAERQEGYGGFLRVWQRLIRAPECFAAAWAYEGALMALGTDGSVPWL